MADLPTGVTGSQIILGPLLDAAGNAAHLSASIAVVLPSGIAHIIWTSTDEQMRTAAAPMLQLTGGDDTALALDVPVVDQSGWQTPGDGSDPPAAITGWSYLLAGSAKWDAGDKQAFQVPFQALTGQATVPVNVFKQQDEGAAVGSGFSAPTAFVASVFGKSGTVTVGDARAALREWAGAGAPTTPGGAITYALGDRYWRTDTPGVANQRLYFCTAGGTSPTWTGIL